MIYISSLIYPDQSKHVVKTVVFALGFPLKPQPLQPESPHTITGFFNWQNYNLLY